MHFPYIFNIPPPSAFLLLSSLRGSLLVAILEAICYMITQTKKYIEKYANETAKKILCLVFIVLKCLQKCLEIFNFYVYVVSGIYGYGVTVNFCQQALLCPVNRSIMT